MNIGFKEVSQIEWWWRFIDRNCDSNIHGNNIKCHGSEYLFHNIHHLFTLILGGISLRPVRVIFKVISALFLVFGIYLIFIGEGITGTISIVLALCIFPRGKRRYKSGNSNDLDHDHEDNNNDSSYDGDSGGDAD